MNPGVPASSGIRKYPRIGVDLSVRVLPNDGRATFARAHDISCGGMALYVPLDLNLEEVIKINFELPNSRVQFVVSGVVKNRNGFRYGVEFVQLTSEQSKELERVLAILALVRH